jgi:thiosulfate/3-mercaptopyruvate sulfurtransferase
MTDSSLSARALSARLADPRLTVVDLRPIAAYNGWRLAGEQRGGHIPGARAFPRAWFESVDDAEIRRLLDAKDVTAEHTIVMYDDDGQDTGAVRDRLHAFGLGDVHVLDGGFAAWAADETLPIERLPRYERLVPTVWLRSLLAGERPDTFAGGEYRLLHVNFGVPEEYVDGHLPGALYLDTNRLEDPADWDRRSPAEIEAALLELGIAHDTTVVVYGRDTVGHANEKWPGRRAGQIAATRAALILRYAGVEDVRLLDGGYDWWVGEGLPIETTLRRPLPVEAFGRSIPQHPEYLLDLPDAKAIVADPAGAALVSVRTWREHIGAVSGYNYIGPAGRIKGDVWGNCGSDAYHMQHYRNVDNTMRAYPEIVANWAEAGITADKHVAFYCGTGWRAAETWFYADLLGWPQAAVYDGGWFEWSQDPINNPIEIGLPNALADDEDEAAA